jgi:hypothetical protein
MCKIRILKIRDYEEDDEHNGNRSFAEFCGPREPCTLSKRYVCAFEERGAGDPACARKPKDLFRAGFGDCAGEGGAARKRSTIVQPRPTGGRKKIEVSREQQMEIMLDADVVIRGEKGTFDLRNWVESLPKERFEIAAITVAELWHGVDRATGTHKIAGSVI